MPDNIMIVSEDELQEFLRIVITEVFESKLDQLSRKQEGDDTILTRNQASKFLQVSLPTLHAWTQSNEIPHRRIGGRIYYSKQQLIKKIRNDD